MNKTYTVVLVFTIMLSTLGTAAHAANPTDAILWDPVTVYNDGSPIPYPLSTSITYIVAFVRTDGTAANVSVQAPATFLPYAQWPAGQHTVTVQACLGDLAAGPLDCGLASAPIAIGTKLIPGTPQNVHIGPIPTP